MGAVKLPTIDYSAVISAVIGIADASTTMRVECGVLPPAAGVSVVSAGGTTKAHMDGGMFMRLPISINIKGETHDAECLTALGAVHSALISAALPNNSGWQMTGISIKSPPMYLGPDTSGMHLYGSSIEARIFVKG